MLSARIKSRSVQVHGWRPDEGARAAVATWLAGAEASGEADGFAVKPAARLLRAWASSGWGRLPAAALRPLVHAAAPPADEQSGGHAGDRLAIDGPDAAHTLWAVACLARRAARAEARATGAAPTIELGRVLGHLHEGGPDAAGGARARLAAGLAALLDAALAAVAAHPVPGAAKRVAKAVLAAHRLRVEPSPAAAAAAVALVAALAPGLRLMWAWQVGDALFAWHHAGLAPDVMPAAVALAARLRAADRDACRGGSESGGDE